MLLIMIGAGRCDIAAPATTMAQVLASCGQQAVLGIPAGKRI